MSITYLEAIHDAQAKALREDPRVFIYGQDIGAFGGAFKATKNLAKEFPGRVIDAPISEDAIIGAAIGSAIEGMNVALNYLSGDWSRAQTELFTDKRFDSCGKMRTCADRSRELANGSRFTGNLQSFQSAAKFVIHQRHLQTKCGRFGMLLSSLLPSQVEGMVVKRWRSLLVIVSCMKTGSVIKSWDFVVVSRFPVGGK